MKQFTIIFIDWDDTLFPTSWVSDNRIDLSSSKQVERYLVLFSELDNVLYDFLKKSLSLGEIIIVTNASYSWVEQSLALIPNSSRLIKTEIKIHSARDRYGHHKDMYRWKQFAFLEETKKILYDKHTHNIISIGDADYEHEAMIKLMDNRCRSLKIPNKRILKKIKFLSSPSYYSVIDQILVLTECISKIVRKRKHVDLLFEHKNK